MNKLNYKIMKVFDCQYDPGMPDDVKNAFFKVMSEQCVGNDTYVKWWINDEGYDGEPSPHALMKKKVDAWLIENGAEPPENNDEEGEEVLIKHWW